MNIYKQKNTSTNMTISTDLLKLETDSKVYKRGEEYYNENPINQLNYSLNRLILEISTDIKEYSCKISYNLETGKLENKKCTCYYFENNNKICKHIITLSLQSNHKLKETIKNLEILDSYEKSEKILNNIITLNSTTKKENQTKINQAQTVTQVTKTIKSLLEENPTLNNIYLKGEISNINLNKSGHIYFSIKDDYSLLNCVMFKASAQSLLFNPQIGDKVLLRGNITLYEPRGTYQLLVKEMKKKGQGDLFQQFLQLKNKLQLKGLFNENKKKKIPQYPQKIGIISSPTGAVIQDIINTIKRRFPKIILTLYPTQVQGEESEKQIIRALKYLDNKKQNFDTIIIARGGGSIEDLWCFNNEQLAREIYNTKTPIISAIGHETDFTICDFVADIRAPTPTAAAELSTPNLFDLNLNLNNNKRRIIKSLEYNLENKKLHLNNLESNIYTNLDSNLQTKKHQLQNLKDKLKLLSINSTLKRGFSITIDKNGKTIKNLKNLKKDDKITTILNTGKITSIIRTLK